MTRYNQTCVCCACDCQLFGIDGFFCHLLYVELQAEAERLQHATEVESCLLVCKSSGTVLIPTEQPLSCLYVSVAYWQLVCPLHQIVTCLVQIEQRELQAEAERMEREIELEKARDAERQKKLDEAAAKQQARLREIEEKEVMPALPIEQSTRLSTLL